MIFKNKQAKDKTSQAPSKTDAIIAIGLMLIGIVGIKTTSSLFGSGFAVLFLFVFIFSILAITVFMLFYHPKNKLLSYNIVIFLFVFSSMSGMQLTYLIFGGWSDVIFVVGFLFLTLMLKIIYDIWLKQRAN